LTGEPAQAPFEATSWIAFATALWNGDVFVMNADGSHPRIADEERRHRCRPA
jgi:hypothetical protein